MQKKEKLEFHHQLLLEAKFKNLNLNLSEYAFANLYLFRMKHAYELLFEDELFIKGRTREGQPFLMPTSHPKEWSKETFKFICEQPDPLYPIPFEWLGYFEKYSKSFSFYEADSDYLFLTDKIALYPGRNLSKKRSLVKQLFEQHQVKSCLFQSEYKREALEIIEMWQDETSFDKDETDYNSVVEAIHFYDELHLHGRLYLVDGTPKGILIGESLNNSCFAFHFVKASRSVHGLNQFMFQDFTQSLEKKYQLLNFEQDLGLPNLRQTKHSYQPDQLLQKYHVYLAEHGTSDSTKKK